MSYECKSGHNAVSGDAVRGCQADGSMTGQPLECKGQFEVHVCISGLAVWTLNWKHLSLSVIMEMYVKAEFISYLEHSNVLDSRKKKKPTK